MQVDNISEVIMCHYSDIIMGTIMSQITSLMIVYSTIYSKRRSKKTSKFHFTGLCEGNSLVTGEFPAQRASNGENASIWWCRHISWPQTHFGIRTTPGGGINKIVDAMAMIPTLVRWNFCIEIAPMVCQRNVSFTAHLFTKCLSKGINQKHVSS